MKAFAYRGPVMNEIEDRPETDTKASSDAIVKIVKTAFGPDGSMLTLASLPASNTKHWVARRKAEVVVAVESGLLSLHEACERYNLTVWEFLSWQRAIQRYGVDGLRASRAQQYRDATRN